MALVRRRGILSQFIDLPKWYDRWVKIVLAGAKHPRAQEILVAHLNDLLEKIKPLMKTLESISGDIDVCFSCSLFYNIQPMQSTGKVSSKQQNSIASCVCLYLCLPHHHCLTLHRCLTLHHCLPHHHTLFMKHNNITGGRKREVWFGSGLCVAYVVVFERGVVSDSQTDTNVYRYTINMQCMLNDITLPITKKKYFENTGTRRDITTEFLDLFILWNNCKFIQDHSKGSSERARHPMTEMICQGATGIVAWETFVFCYCMLCLFYSSVMSNTVFFLFRYECTEWSHIKPKGYVVTAEKYIDIFQRYVVFERESLFHRSLWLCITLSHIQTTIKDCERDWRMRVIIWEQ